MDIGRVSTSYVSAHTRTRPHNTRVYPTEKRELVADFNGAIPADRSVVSAEWRMESACSVAMSNVLVTTRTTQVTMQGVYRGRAFIKATVTLDNGEVYNQLFVVDVLDGPWFGDENSLSAGPVVLTATP